MAAAAAAAGVEIVAGDTKVVERGHADAMYVCTTGRRARLDPRARLSPADAPARATGSSSRARSASTARRSCSPAASSSSSAEIESDTRSLWPAVDALLEAAGPALRCMRDATRGGVASVLNELARASGVAMLVREAAVPVQPGGGGRGEMLGHRPDVRGQRGQARRLRGARARPTRRWPRCAAVAGLRGGGGDRRGEDRAAGDGAGGDRVRRQAGDGPARGRSAAADLLSRRGAQMATRRVRTRTRTRRRRSPRTSSG